MEEAAPKRTVEEKIGRAKIAKQFSTRRDKSTIGGTVLEGRMEKGEKVRIMRRQEPVGLGKITGLQSHKSNVDRVETGGEFGAEITSEFEVMHGDVLECFRINIV